MRGSHSFSFEQAAQIISDLVAILLIFAVGWFLIGYYTHYQFLSINYQDWMSHAFRIESIKLHGMVSWDHLWDNGINYWRSYQFLPHLLVLGVSNLFHLSIPQAMLISVVFVFLFTRLSTYVVLRSLKITPLIALFATVASYTFEQQWGAVKDFTLFLSMGVLPIFVLLWILAIKRRRFFYILAAFSGLTWMVHPILGYSCSGLFFSLYLFSSPKLKMKTILSSLAVFLTAWMSFVIPYVFYGYGYTNPIFSFAQFLRDTVIPVYFGLSLMYVLLLITSWGITLLLTAKIERWSKLLLLYITVYVFVIMAGQAGYLPGFINQLQVSRGIVVVGFLLPFVFASSLQTVLHKVESKFLFGFIAIVLALSITEAISVSTEYTATPVNTIHDPVQEFFKDHDHTGSVYIENVSQASFFSNDGIRYATSYNEHLEPHPLTQRFHKLVRSDLVYRGVTVRQSELVSAYAKLFGMEYLFLPDFSPLTQYLLDNPDKTTQVFTDAGKVMADENTYVVLHNQQPVHYAYLADADAVNKNFSFATFRKPTLQVETFQPWDEEVMKEVAFESSDQATPVPVKFVKTDTLEFTLPSNVSLDHKVLIINQSYDNNWQVKEFPNAHVRPTALRFMTLPLNASMNGKTLTLKNSWPNWYWPVQALCYVVFAVAAIGEGLALVYSRRKKAKAKK